MNKNCVDCREQEQNENEKYFEHREREQNKLIQDIDIFGEFAKHGVNS